MLKRTKEVKRAISLSCSLIAKLRQLSDFNSWTKDDFIFSQCAHEVMPHPNSKDHVARWLILRRFAIRCDFTESSLPDISVPFKKVSQKPRKKPNTTYGESIVFTSYRKVRYDALLRSGGCCECCGNTPKSSGKPLHIDHIKPKSIYPELKNELSNFQVLCADCNIGKGNWDETNWREQRAGEDADEQLDRELILDKSHLN